MSVYKPKSSPFYHYDFQWRGRRFCGSTERTSRREAEQVETAKRGEAKAEVKRAADAKGSMQLADVSARYWTEVGQHTANAKTTERDLARLTEHFGRTKLLTEITDSDIAGLVAWRRGHHVVRSKAAKLADCPLISNATVNRSTTELLRRLFSRARKSWGAKFDAEPKWTEHLLAETEERVRELHGTERAKLNAETRDDYAPYFAFVAATGLRQTECLLRWADVNWDARQITRRGKGNKRVTTPITNAIRRILWPLRGHHPEFVFTYVAVRTRGDRVRGRRYPLTREGVKTQWRRLRRRAGVKDFRFHDFRHDVGTKLLRETGNLKLVQKALNHANIASTVRYAHVLDSEIAAALEAVSKSRNNSRSVHKIVA